MASSDEETYAPNELRRLAGVELGHFDYWKKALEPKKENSGYYDEDVLAWLVMKEAVVGCRLEVKLAKKFDWKYIFAVCHELTEGCLSQGRFVFDLVTDNVQFMTQDEKDPSPRKRNQLASVYMDEIYDSFSTNKLAGIPTKVEKVVSHDKFKLAGLNKAAQKRKASTNQ